MSERGRLRRIVRKFARDIRATAAIEFAFIAPAMLALMALIVFAGEGFEIQRKVTMTMRTLTDLVAQQCDVGPTPYSTLSPVPPDCPAVANAYTYSQIIGASCYAMVPYVATVSPCSAPDVTFAIAALQLPTSGGGSATQAWCQYTTGGASLCPAGAGGSGQSVTLPNNLQATPQGSSQYPQQIIYGVVQYNFKAPTVWFQANAFTFSDSLYLLPRVISEVACSGC